MRTHLGSLGDPDTSPHAKQPPRRRVTPDRHLARSPCVTAQTAVPHSRHKGVAMCCRGTPARSAECVSTSGQHVANALEHQFARPQTPDSGPKQTASTASAGAAKWTNAHAARRVLTLARLCFTRASQPASLRRLPVIWAGVSAGGSWRSSDTVEAAVGKRSRAGRWPALIMRVVTVVRGRHGPGSLHQVRGIG